LHNVSSIRVGRFMTVRVGAALSLAVGLSGACRNQPLGPMCGDGICGSEESVTWSVTGGYGDTALDVLFVIDDTPAIAGSQAALAAAIPQVAQFLQSRPGGLPSLHLGIAAASPTPSDGGEDVPRTRASDCGLGAGLSFLSTDSCGKSPTFRGTFTDALSCLADLGTTASGPVQPLSIVQRISSGPSTAGAGWTGFSRPSAYLMLVIVAGQDDASGPLDPAALADAVRGLKSDPLQTVVSVIAPSPTCAMSPAISTPRLSTFVTTFGSQGYEGCTPGDLVNWLMSLFKIQDDDFGGSGCHAGIRDTDPTQPGLQADCTVDDRIWSSDGSRSESLPPSCDVSGPPCWTFTPGSADVCPGRWLFAVDRGPDFCPQVAIQTEVTCLGCVDPSDPACSGPPQSDAGP
jgi:hypothetical protein